ncbi:MAG TPA: hypothetical protein VMN43_10690 [Aestuariivirgaceae bacterium]|nr:hypothetical protein [Aestuariivirgaceae bacterium]
MAHTAQDLTITRLEKIARDLASVLSPKGEADWRRFVAMADKVGTRMFQQLAEIIPSDSPSRPSPAVEPAVAPINLNFG